MLFNIVLRFHFFLRRLYFLSVWEWLRDRSKRVFGMGQWHKKLHVHGHDSRIHGIFKYNLIVYDIGIYLKTIFCWRKLMCNLYFDFSSPCSYVWLLCLIFQPHKQEKLGSLISLKHRVRAWRCWCFCLVSIGRSPTMLIWDIQMWKKLIFIRYSRSLTLGLVSSFLHSWVYSPPIIEQKSLQALWM